MSLTNRDKMSFWILQVSQLFRETAVGTLKEKYCWYQDDPFSLSTLNSLETFKMSELSS